MCPLEHRETTLNELWEYQIGNFATVYKPKIDNEYTYNYPYTPSNTFWFVWLFPYCWLYDKLLWTV